MTFISQNLATFSNYDNKKGKSPDYKECFNIHFKNNKVTKTHFKNFTMC